MKTLETRSSSCFLSLLILCLAKYSMISADAFQGITISVLDLSPSYVGLM